MPRETESNLQVWNSDPNASGSRTWLKEEKSTASRTKKLTRTNRTCKESKKKPKTCDCDRGVKDNPPKHNRKDRDEIQGRNNKVECQRCYSYTAAGFQVSMRRTTEHVGTNTPTPDENLSNSFFCRQIKLQRIHHTGSR